MNFDASSSRRAWVAGLALAGLGLAGGGLFWRARRSQSAALSDSETAFWRMRFARLDGSDLILQDFFGYPLLLNFWAPWCAPCVEEIPLLNAFYAEKRSKRWQILGLAVDAPNPVRQFLVHSPVDFPIALAGLAGITLSQALGNVGAALPFTVFFDSKGSVKQRKIGQLKPFDLQNFAPLIASREIQQSS